MAIQGAINRLIGTAGAVVTLADKLGNKSEVKQSSGIDSKMAEKARRIAKQKINNIYVNRELSEETKKMRIEKVIDDYSDMIGGGK